MAFSQSDLTAIQGAIARGERTVEFHDRRVTYRSVAELVEAESHIARTLAGGDNNARHKQTVLIGEKGL